MVLLVVYKDYLNTIARGVQIPYKGVLVAEDL